MTPLHIYDRNSRNETTGGTASRSWIARNLQAARLEFVILGRTTAYSLAAPENLGVIAKSLQQRLFTRYKIRGG